MSMLVDPSMILQTTVTGAGGTYSFAVVPGTYYLKEVLQSNWVQWPALGSFGSHWGKKMLIDF